MGTGLGAGGAGVRQTSGMAKQLPPPFVDAGNIAGIEPSPYGFNLHCSKFSLKIIPNEFYLILP
jgi:hypothetical protein